MRTPVIIDPIMKCLRCGQCCFHLDIFIINPRSILPDGTVSSDDPEAMIFKPAQQMCPHLSIENDRSTSTATCTIHHLPCYRGTPCEQFEQLGPAEDVCFMSGYFLLQGMRVSEPQS
jgi:hypothetical protein